MSGKPLNLQIRFAEYVFQCYNCRKDADTRGIGMVKPIILWQLKDEFSAEEKEKIGNINQD